MTTDTAFLVSREILEEGKTLGSLAFVTDPAIPCDNDVRRYLDMALPLASLSSEKFKGQSLAALRSQEMLEKDVTQFQKYC